MLRLKPQTAYNSDYHETLFFDGYHYDCLHNVAIVRFDRLLFLSNASYMRRHICKIPSVFGFKYVSLSLSYSLYVIVSYFYFHLFLFFFFVFNVI